MPLVIVLRRKRKELYTIILTGLILGLGVGISCAALCMPILAPHIAARYPSSKRGLYASILFSIGRLASYLILGISAGFLGGVIFSNASSESLTAPVILVIGCLLIFHGLSVSFMANTRIDVEICRYLGIDRSTIVLGLLAGFRPCLPLIAAVTYSVTLANLVESALFMIAFWLGSSLYTFVIGIMAGTVTGMAILHISRERIRRISGIALIVVGIVFLIEGATFLIKL